MNIFQSVQLLIVAVIHVPAVINRFDTCVLDVIGVACRIGFEGGEWRADQALHARHAFLVYSGEPEVSRRASTVLQFCYLLWCETMHLVWYVMLGPWWLLV